jgi:16S rRNA (guanine1207-N2)-methyltransferase
MTGMSQKIEFSSDDYHQIQSYTLRLNQVETVYYAKSGLPSWEQSDPTSVLIANHIRIQDRGMILIMGCGTGALAAYLGRQHPSCQFWLTDTSHIASEMTRRTLIANQVKNAQIIPPDCFSLPGLLDSIVIVLPKGRSLARRWIMQAEALLRPQGELYLAGCKNQGIQSVIRDAAAVFSEPTILGYKKGCQLARLIKMPRPTGIGPEWANDPGISPGSWIEFDVETPVGRLHLYSLPGVFSADKLDKGTALLLEHLSITPETRLLDIGCGYGVIGLVGILMGAKWADMIDSNLMAVSACHQNLSTRLINNGQVMASDALDTVLNCRYSLVVSNPPFHSGHNVDYQMAKAFIQQAWQVLEPGGRLMLVTNQFIRYDSLIEAHFKQVQCLSDQAGYRILAASKG